MPAYSYINPAMNRLLHSPWHRMMSKRIMSVSYRGRKSDQAYCTPVSYYREGDTVYCFTNGSWRYNFKKKHTATLRLQGHDYIATGEVYCGDREHQLDTMANYFKAVPQDKKFYGVRCDKKGEPLRPDIERASGIVDMIHFDLQG
mgnify:CR=1 FL=1